MAHKTMLRQLISKWGTMSIELAQAADADMAVIREDGSRDYVENSQEDSYEANVVQEPEQLPDTMQETATAQQDAEAAFFS